MTAEKLKPIPLNRRESFHQWFEAAAQYFKVPPDMPVWEWCANNVRFDEPGKARYYQTDGREYIKEPLDTFRNNRIHDVTLVFGSQTGKTSMMMAGVAWTIYMRSVRILWVMTSASIARNFSDTRWCPMVLASATKELIDGQYAVLKSHQKIGGSIIDFVGAHSEGGVASTPCDMTILDEVDKYPHNVGKEADTVHLAEQRTKDAPVEKHIKTCTPSTEDGLIWQEFRKGNQCRYYMPCYFCGREILFAWSKNFYTFPKKGCEAYVVWDPSLRRANGSWDLNGVEKDAHFVCPYCGGKIYDAEKRAMIANGVWHPENESASKSNYSYQLSSLYSCAPSCAIGRLAVKFLQDKQSLMGLQSFVNGELAEPWIAQDDVTKTEYIVSEKAPLDPEGTWARFITADFQETEPHLYWVCRAWDQKTGNSRLIEHGSCNEFDQLAAVQKRLGVMDICVGIDCGYEPISVYNACADHGKIKKRSYDPKYPYRQLNVMSGWQPMKGFGQAKTFYDSKHNPQLFGWGEGKMPHKDFGIQILEFNSSDLKDILKRLRERKTQEHWEITAEWDTDEYRMHLMGEIKKRCVRFGMVTYQWAKRTNNWPNHWLDCEVMQLAMAMRYGALKMNNLNQKNDDNNQDAE